MVNKINVTLRTSRDREGIQAIRKVSDKLTVVGCFMSGPKKEDNTYGKAMNVDVKVTTKTNLNGLTLAQGMMIDVDGFLSVENYEKDGKTFAKWSIVANSITATPQNENAGQAQQPSNPAQQQAAPQEQSQPQIPEDDDLPFM